MKYFLKRLKKKKNAKENMEAGHRKEHTIGAKKTAMLWQNTCFEDYDELEDVLSIPSELTDTSYQPLSHPRPNRWGTLNVVNDVL